EIISGDAIDYEETVKGWVRTIRSNRINALNDESSVKRLQIVIDYEKKDSETLKGITTVAAVKIKGKVVAYNGMELNVEVHADVILVLGKSDANEYPLQPKKHSLDFLRDIAHLRFRTNTFGAIFRIRHSLAFAVHQFFNEKGFVYL